MSEDEGRASRIRSPGAPRAGPGQPECTAADPGLDSAFAVAEAIRDYRLRRITEGVLDAGRIGSAAEPLGG
jgi:hypothetical protein